MAFDAFIVKMFQALLLKNLIKPLSSAKGIITMALEIRTLWISADSNIIMLFKLTKSHNFDQTQCNFFMSHTSLCFMQNSSFNTPNTNII